jgi:hypothetical protein
MEAGTAGEGYYHGRIYQQLVPGQKINSKDWL